MSKDPISGRQAVNGFLLPAFLFYPELLYDYSYVKNNPINYIDPFGLQAVPIPIPPIPIPQPIREGGSQYEECVRACDEGYRADSDICASLPCPEERAKCYAEAMKAYAACLRTCAALLR